MTTGFSRRPLFYVVVTFYPSAVIALAYLDELLAVKEEEQPQNYTTKAASVLRF
jgi:hypothetical protein